MSGTLGITPSDYTQSWCEHQANITMSMSDSSLGGTWHFSADWVLWYTGFGQFYPIRFVVAEALLMLLEMCKGCCPKKYIQYVLCCLLGGLELFLLFHVIIGNILIDFHNFQRCRSTANEMWVVAIFFTKCFEWLNSIIPFKCSVRILPMKISMSGAWRWSCRPQMKMMSEKYWVIKQIQAAKHIVAFLYR